MTEQALDLTLPFKVNDLETRIMMQYAKHSLVDFMISLHGFELYEPMQSMILERLENGSREMLMIFREWGKSTSIEDLAVKELTFDEESFVIVFGRSDAAAESRVSAIRTWFELDTLPNGKKNPLTQLKPTKKGRGDKKYKWTNTDFILNHGNRCKGLGFMTAILGIKEFDMRPTLIIIDDPTDPESAADDAKMIRRLLQTITPLGSPMTRIIITLTPRRFTDIGMTIMRDKESVYNVHFYPAVTDDGKVTCPSFWLRRGSCCNDKKNPNFNCHDLEGEELIRMHIEQKKRDVKTIGWHTEYLLKPVDDGSSLFPMTTLNPCKLDDDEEKGITFKHYRTQMQKALEYYRLTGVALPTRTKCVIGVDLSLSQSVDSDFTVFSVLSCEDGKPLRLLHAERFRGVSFKEQKNRLFELYLLFNPELIKIETNGFQIVFADDMSEYQSLMRISGHQTHTEKHTVSIGIPGMKSVFENQNFEFPYGDAKTKLFVDNLFHELHGMIFEQGKVKSITKHDDCVMSLWLAYMAAKEIFDNQIVIYDGLSFS